MGMLLRRNKAKQEASKDTQKKEPAKKPTKAVKK